MFLAPKRTKFKKSFSRTSILTSKKSQDSPSFGNFFLLASSCGYVSNRQIEALRIFLRRSLKKQAKIWIRIFPNLPITKKPEEVRMGKGKASVKKWSARVRPGQIIFELKTKASINLKKTLNFSKFKISLKTKSLNQKMWWIF